MACVMEFDEQSLVAKFDALLPHLDERTRRLVLGAEARSWGHGGIELVARAAGVSRKTVSAGAAGVEAGQGPVRGRGRRPGGGREAVWGEKPGLGGPGGTGGGSRGSGGAQVR